MKTLAPLALLALALAVAVPAQAQDPQVFTATGGSAGELAYEGSGAIPVELSVGCSFVLQSAADEFTGTITATDAPAWLSVTETSFEVDPTLCANPANPTLQATATASVPIAVTKDAPGVVEQLVTLQATVGDGTTTTVGRYSVAYHSNYTLVADAQFPLTVTGESVTFKVTATQASNARSMIMVEELTTTAGAVFSGISSTVYEVEAGKPASKTFDVTFKAPSGEWTSSEVSFKTFGHYLLISGPAGDYEPAKPYTYTFVNGNVGEPAGTGGGKESPAPVGALTALGLLGLAAAVRRKA